MAYESKKKIYNVTIILPRKCSATLKCLKKVQIIYKWRHAPALSSNNSINGSELQQQSHYSKPVSKQSQNKEEMLDVTPNDVKFKKQHQEFGSK